MAQVYYPKKTSQKFLEGAIAGLLGGVAALLVAVLSDVLTPNQSWWTSISVVGGILTGVKDFNTASPDMGSLLLGLVLSLVVWAIMAFGFKISSLAALTAALLLPLGGFYVFGNSPTAWATVAIALLLFWRHRANIEKLFAGKESTIGR